MVEALAFYLLQLLTDAFGRELILVGAVAHAFE